MPAPSTHRVVTGRDGEPVLVKRASDPAAAARLTGEAAVLRALAHPGTVRVVDHRTDPDGAELHLAWVGPHSLATVAGLSPAAAGDLVAQVAETVADLHRAGVVHGRLTADHVLLGPAGRAVLTGFAAATGARAGGPDPADDVAALGLLLTRMVAPHDAGPVIPETRRARSGDGGRRAALLTLADRAQADEPGDRPSAAELARSIRAAVGPPPRPRRRGRRVRTAAGIGLAGALLVAGATMWPGPASGPPAGLTPTTTTLATPTTRDAPTTTRPPTTTRDAPTTLAAPSTTHVPATTTAPVCPPAPHGTRADVDGDGCVESVRIEGERVTVGTTTWRAGRPGDVAAVGDWDCDGDATIATLRPSTGEVFVFDRWEPALTIDPTARVSDATDVRPAEDPDDDGCVALLVDRTGGAPVTVEVAG